jgi:diguanylate cyclase (GGDEF)-like protein
MKIKPASAPSQGDIRAFAKPAPEATAQWIAAELSQLTAVVAAVLDADGQVIEANAGFMRIISDEGLMLMGAHAGAFFIQPSFLSIITSPADASGIVYNGLITLGTLTGTTRTLRGTAWRKGTSLCVLAEYDIEELERVCNTVLNLNREIAHAQSELAQANIMLRQREANIRAISLTDKLTGVGNRRRLEEALLLEISRADRTADPLCAIMCDIDHFKQVNDVHGHELGDKVLAAFAATLLRQTRPTDIVNRYGGEEFVILTPNTGLSDALDAAERIRLSLCEIRVEPLESLITASFGVAQILPGEPGAMLMRRIDSALYAAKQGGRNCVSSA